MTWLTELRAQSMGGGAPGEQRRIAGALGLQPLLNFTTNKPTKARPKMVSKISSASMFMSFDR